MPHEERKPTTHSWTYTPYFSLNRTSKFLIMFILVEIISFSLSLESYLNWYLYGSTLNMDTEENDNLKVTLVEQLSHMDWYSSKLKAKVLNSQQDNFRLASEELLSYVAIPTTVLFFFWFYKAYKNLDVLGVKDLSKPSQVIIFSFVPIINMWRPYKEMQKIWRCSDSVRSSPNLLPRLDDKSPHRSYVVFVWWVCGWLSIIFSAVTVLGLNDFSGDSLQYSLTYSLQYTIQFSFLSLILAIVSAIALIIVIHGINRKQSRAVVTRLHDSN